MENEIITGLTAEEVESRIKENKVNGNFAIKTKSIKQIIFTNVFTLFNFVNIFLAVCVFLVKSYKNMLFLGVVLWNIFIGVFQEIRSKRIIDKLSILSAKDVTVVRNGKYENIKISDIVLDDIMVLKNGNQISADAVVVEGDCEVNESMITGESDAIYKKNGDEILSGSFLVSGEVKARVIHVGKENYVNKITSQAKYLKKPNSEMLKSIKLIVKVITIVLIPIALLLFKNQITMPNATLKDAVVATVAAVIGMIPSGLILLTSMVLAVSVIRLAKKNTLVQELFCIETLARVDVLCLDKTGTITEGSMGVDKVEIFDDRYFTGDIKYVLKIYSSNAGDDNPTSLALSEYANSQVLPKEVNIEELKEISKLNIVERIPFSSDKKWGAVEVEKNGTYIVGALEYIANAKTGNIENIRNAVKKYTSKGLRVLVIAHTNSKVIDKKLPDDIEIIAAVAIADKIRKEAYDTIAYFKRQGVYLKVISGDNPETVSYIANKVGIKDADKYIDVSKLSDDELRECVEDYSVFGRVRPNQKLVLVQALKEKGHTVAMTGDGVNDVLALKEADCSVAMQSGSEAARNVSQIVLLDSNFASMPEIVAEGRRTINNMQRSASLYLTKTIYSTLLAIVFVFLNRDYPFVPIQLTLIGALTIGIPSFILAMEPNANRVKGRFLMNVLRMAIPGGVLAFGNIMLGQAFGWITNCTKMEISTLAVCGLAIAAYIELVKLCRPFNMLRRTLCIGITVIFIAASTIFNSFFNFSYLKLNQFIFLLIVVLVSGVVFMMLEVLIEQLFGTTPNIYHIDIARAGGKNIIFVNDDVEKKDYYDVTSQMKSVRLIGADSVVFVKNPINNGDIRIEGEDEIGQDEIAAASAFYMKKNKIADEEYKIICETEGRKRPYNLFVSNKHRVKITYEKEDIGEQKAHILKKMKITF